VTLPPPLTAERARQVPESIGHYRILEHLGTGKLGDVYRARDTRVGRTVEIKVLPEDVASVADRRERLLAAARLATTISHPNIAALYEIGIDDGLYLVHEFVPGRTLTAIAGGRPLNPRRAIDLAAQIADALAEAHASHVIHGGLGMDAIVVTPKGHPKVVDFGLEAASLPDAPDRGAQRDRGDIAALGVILFELLTGTPPVAGANLPGVIIEAIPRELDPIVAKAIGERGAYASAATLAADLRAAGATIDARKRATEVPRAAVAAARGQRSRAAGRIAAGLVLGALAVLLWWYFRTW
jgi:serine/threonine protein kinase